MKGSYLKYHPSGDCKLALLLAVAGLALIGCAYADQANGRRPGQDFCARAINGKDAPATTPLSTAALFGDIETANRLIDEGVEVDTVSGTGMTPLMLSFQPLIVPQKKSGEDPDALQESKLRIQNKVQIAEALLEQQADTSLADCYGMRAMHYLVLMHADESMLLEMLRTFIEKGADPNAASDEDLTPLMLAAQRNRLQLAKYLVAAGADPTTTTKDGRTALSIARARAHEEMTVLLEQPRQ